ncbi:Pre T-cell antigen receptor alpha [Hibiscus syriacus]|uniref:Pre T-cell antigen receptor alpha n=1 Tax=Hibiscus syriacus TaxID=106335 RepID=A0A6A2XYH6_HIBSY|nr:serine/arginine repetitive matrix protein 1-like [Hibiscus syriacus]KAE8659724.1 Pre T-cell antigen receptor alpha [Hibiscus syriacus]
MGCCVSTNRGSCGEKEAHLEVGLDSFNQKPILESRAPPPSAEEETVKEVLSETPKPKAPILIPQEEEKEKTLIENPAFVKIQGKESLNFNIKHELKSPVNSVEESASENVSEICSVSLSESVSTITDRRDEEEEVRPQRVFRSPARSGPRNLVVGRSPTRKLEQSPGRRNGVINGGSSVRLVQSREPTVRRGSRPEPPRKDPGESSGRRSRSPAMNRSVMGRSPSGRTNQSPGRARLDSGDSGNDKKLEQQQGTTTTTTTTMDGKWPSSNNNGATSSTPNESLENPLVSLECFIFL